jgi:hypothetical protein
MTGKLQTVAEMWQDYRRAVQIQECRRSFYAGVASMYDNATARVADPGVSEDAGVEYFLKIGAELKAYILTVGTKWEDAKSS